MTSEHRIYGMPVAVVYPNYIEKVERKGQPASGVDEIMCWLTGHTVKSLKAELENETDFKTFFNESPKLNPNRKLITGVICGIRVEDMEPSVMQEIRYLDKLVDELAKGKAMEKILRKP